MTSLENNNQGTSATSSMSGTGFGAQFKTVRERKQLSIDDVATELNILNRHLDAIERSDFENLPQKAFTRGFVASYAKFLKLDVNNVLSHFDSIYPQEKQTASIESVVNNSEVKPIGNIKRDSGKKSGFNRTGLILCVLAVLGLGTVYSVMSSKQASEGVVESEPTALESMEQEKQEVLEAQETSDTSDEDKAAAEEAKKQEEHAKAEAEAKKLEEEKAKAEEAKKAEEEQAQAEKAKAELLAQQQEQLKDVKVDPNAKPAELDFRVKRNTDINLVDQTGQVIMSGVKPRGAHVVNGQPPFTIQISNVSNVSLNMDRVPIKLKKYSVDNKADFTLNK